MDLSELSGYLPEQNKSEMVNNSIIVSEQEIQDLKEQIDIQRITLLLSGCLY